MKARIILLLLTLAFALIPLHARPDAKADAAWKKVEFAMNYMAPEKFKGQNQTESKERSRTGITKFDTAMKEFLAVAPNDPRVWDAKVFDAAKLLRERAWAGSPAPAEDPMKVAEDALNAPDASIAAKSMASAFKIAQLGKDAAENKFPADEWLRLTETHLKNFPGKSADNEAVKVSQEQARKLVDLKAMPPIDLKATASDGTEVDLTTMRGKVVLLYFWPGYPNPMWMQQVVQSAYVKYNAKGFEVVGIYSGDKKALDKALKQNPAPWRQIIDSRGEISSHFKVTFRPTMYLFNKQGVLAHAFVREKLGEEVEKLLAE